jgi:hypothetical protein
MNYDTPRNMGGHEHRGGKRKKDSVETTVTGTEPVDAAGRRAKKKVEPQLIYDIPPVGKPEKGSIYHPEHQPIDPVRLYHLDNYEKKVGPKLEPSTTWESSALVAHDIRGLQVGDHNFQTNTFVTEIEADVPNVEEILAHPDVRRVLEKMDQHPASPRAADQVEDALAHLPGHKKTVKPSITGATHEAEGGRRGLLSAIFVLKSSGVQVGSNMLQRNYFTYTVTPDLETAQLLAGSPDLRAGIVESCKLEGPNEPPGEELASAMHESLRSACEDLLDPASRGVVLHPSAGETTYIKNVDGATYGQHVSQKNMFKINTIIRAAKA